MTTPALDKKVIAKNLLVYCLLSSVVTFACVLIVDQIVGALGGSTTSIPVIMGLSALVGVGGFVSGLLYIPAAGTINENLFKLAAVSLIGALTIYRVFTVGFDWGALTVFVLMVCLAVTAYVVPTRVTTLDQRKNKTKNKPPRGDGFMPVTNDQYGI